MNPRGLSIVLWIAVHRAVHADHGRLGGAVRSRFCAARAADLRPALDPRGGARARPRPDPAGAAGRAAAVGGGRLARAAGARPGPACAVPSGVADAIAESAYAALSNVVRHAPGAAATLRLNRDATPSWSRWSTTAPASTRPPSHPTGTGYASRSAAGWRRSAAGPRSTRRPDAAPGSGWSGPVSADRRPRAIRAPAPGRPPCRTGVGRIAGRRRSRSAGTSPVNRARHRWRHGRDYRRPWAVPAAGWLLFAASALVALPRRACSCGGSRCRRGRWSRCCSWSTRRLRGTAGDGSCSPPPTGCWGTVGWFAVLALWGRRVVGLVARAGHARGDRAGRRARARRRRAVDLSRYVDVRLRHVGRCRWRSSSARDVVRARPATAATPSRPPAAVEARAARRRARACGNAGTGSALVSRPPGGCSASWPPAGPTPTTRTVQRRCALAAARLRRLIAESDDVPDPLLHELRACVDLAERNGLPVDLVAVGDPAAAAGGDPPPAGRTAHRAPWPTPGSWARLTVVAGPDEVVVSLVTPGPGGAGGDRPATLEHDDGRGGAPLRTGRGTGMGADPVAGG